MKFRPVARVALHDLSRWRKMPLTAACAVVPPIAMMIILATLSLGVTQQPVALVIQGTGPASTRMAQIIENDTDAYYLTICNSSTANAMLKTEQVAAIITIPANFDSAVKNGTGKLILTVDNTDYDFSDDIRRAIDMSVVQFDAPTLISQTTVNSTSSNVYHVSINETYLRKTSVDWFHYQLVPTFVLMILNVGLVGTSVLCAVDEDRKTARMMLLSPQPSWALVAGRILGGMLLCLIVMIPVLIFSALVGFISLPVGQIPALAGIFTGTAFCAAGTGAVVGSCVKGTRYVAFLSTVIATYLFFLGGGFTAIEFAPQWLQQLSTFIPTTYSIDALRQVLFYPNPIGVPLSIAVLFSYAVGCVWAGALLMRRSMLRQ